MKLVAFDTSTEACSVAVQIDGEVRVDHRIVQREHSALLLPMVQGLLDQFSVKPAELDGVVFGQGPGSFTGLRIAAAAAQGLAMAANCGVQGVSSLEAIASACMREHPDDMVGCDWLMSAIDARVGQIYANCYQAQVGVPALGDEVVVNADEFAPAMLSDELLLGSNDKSASESSNPERLIKRLVLCGSGAERYESALAARFTEFKGLELSLISGVYPHALDLLSLIDTSPSAQWLPPQEAQPVYLKNKIAFTEAERAST